MSHLEMATATIKQSDVWKDTGLGNGQAGKWRKNVAGTARLFY